MQKSGFLKKITLCFCFFLVFTCFVMANELSSANDTAVSVRAGTVSEGICLSFENIPEGATRLFVIFQDWEGREILSGTHEIIGIYTDITGKSLDQVKQTGRVICPFVLQGQKYHISAYFMNDTDPDFLEMLSAECVADKGTYFNDGIELYLNETQTGVTLSAEPFFTSDVQYDTNKYGYSVTIDLADKGSLGYAENIMHALSWDFEPQLTSDLKEGSYMESGNYPAYVTAYCNLNHDHLTWRVEIAKTKVFLFTL